MEKVEYIKKTVQELEQTLSETKRYVDEEYATLHAKQHKFQEELKSMAERFPVDQQIIHLNVGGRRFTTYKSTLCKHEHSMLEAMFSGRHPQTRDEDGSFVIDRPGDLFAVVLEFLQTDNITWPTDPAQRRRLEREFDFFGLSDAVRAAVPDISVIVTDNLQHQQLRSWIGNASAKLILLYRATRDGFGASNFHSLCDNKGPTLTVVRSTQGYIFGGYNPGQWALSGDYSNVSGSWLFTLINPSGRPYKLNCTNTQNAIYNQAGYGPTFGGNHDLYICNNSNTSAGSYSNLGHAYENQGNRHLFCGTNNFQTTEVEVFSVN